MLLNKYSANSAILGETDFAEYCKGTERVVFPPLGGEYFPLRAAEYFAE